MKTKIVSQQTFDEIKSFGRGVPRDNSREIIKRWKVGGEYIIKSSKERKDEVYVSCSQNCPFHLVAI